MDDTAVFKLDNLPGINITVTRTVDAGSEYPVGFLMFTGRRENPEMVSQSGGSGPVGDGETDTPRIRGGKVPFVFRSLPGYTFYALRYDERIVEKDIAGHPMAQRMPGWIRITYYGPGDDEEHEWGGFAGPES